MSTSYVHKIFILLAFCLHGFGVKSQSSNLSPYSRYGIGDMYDMQMPFNTAMGGITLPLCDSFLLNVANPASYSFLTAHNPVIDVSVRGRMYRFITATDSVRTYTLSPSNIVLGIPLSKRAGLALGVMPFSTAGYNINLNETDPLLGDITYVYSGGGGINRVFAGFAYKVVNQKKHQLSLGLNVSFLFGEIEKIRKVIYRDLGAGAYHSKIINSFYVADAAFDAGLLYRTKINKNLGLNLGMTYGSPKRLHANQTVLAYTFYSLTYESLIDTISYQPETRGYISLPVKWGYAMALEWKEKRQKNPGRITLAAQYDLQNWQDYTEDFGTKTQYDFMSNSNAISVGCTYVPRTLDRTSTRIRTFALSNYRLGAYQRKSYLVLNSHQLTERGITCGIGVPLIFSYSYSMLNIAFEYGARGTVENNLVREKYVGVQIGLSMLPNVQVDRWFIKRKFD